jgi:hypothetical protein
MKLEAPEHVISILGAEIVLLNSLEISAVCRHSIPYGCVSHNETFFHNVVMRDGVVKTVPRAWLRLPQIFGCCHAPDKRGERRGIGELRFGQLIAR